MANQQERFSGLRALAAKLGMGASTAALSAGGAGADEDDRDEGEGAGEGDEAEGQGNDQQQGGEGAGDDAGEGDDDGDDAGAGDDAEGGRASDAGDAGEGEGEGGTASAEYQRGFAAGEQATAGRWAATFLNEPCRANMELATDLLADTDMTPDKIAAYCARNPGAKAGLGKLATTPKPRVGLEGGGADGQPTGDADEGEVSRRAAVTAQARTVRGRAGTRATRKAGGPGGVGQKIPAAAGEK